MDLIGLIHELLIYRYRKYRKEILKLAIDKELERCDFWGRIRSKHIRRVLFCLYAPFFFCRHPEPLLPSYLSLRFAEICLTTRCTLRCRNCANRAQYYASPQREHFNYALQDLQADLTQLFGAIALIGRLRLLGGEPFLYPRLAELIAFLSNSEKVCRIEIVTNGTIMPSEELLRCLKENNASVFISNYGSLSTKKTPLIAALQEHLIDYEVGEPNAPWYDVGTHEPRGRSIEELKDIYHRCALQLYCKHIVDGRVYACSICAHLEQLGLMPEAPSEFVSLRQPSETLQKELRQMLFVDCIPACDHCDQTQGKTIPAAEQLDPGEYL